MKYYCIGIKGSGMSTLANLLFDLGNEIVGYDDSEGYKFTMEGLNKRGIKIHHGESFKYCGYNALPKTSWQCVETGETFDTTEAMFNFNLSNLSIII